MRQVGTARSAVAMSEPAWPSPADDEPQEVAKAEPAKVEQQWLLAWVMIGLFVVLRFLDSPPMATMAYRLGYGTGAAILPLLAAYFVSRFWKHRQAPGVAAAAVLIVSLVGLGATGQKIKRVTEGYIADLKERIATWDARCEKNAEWEAEDLVDREELTACIESYNETLALTSKLLSEMETGDVYRDLLLADKVSSTNVEEAWRGVRETAEFAQSVKVLRASKEVITFTMTHISALDRWHGHWQLAEDGTIEFDETIDSPTLGAFNESVGKLEEAVATLQKLIE